MSRFLKWLFTPGASCADLREECSLAERQVNVLREELAASQEACVALAEGFQVQEQLGEDLLAIAGHLTKERDGLIRELWLERRRNDELREHLAQTRVFASTPPRDSMHREIRERGVRP